MQVRFRGLTATDHRTDDLLVIDHEFAGQSVRSSDQDNLGRAGTTPGRDFAAAGSFKFVLMANQADYQSGVRVLTEFLNIWRDSIEETATGKVFALDFRHGHRDTDNYIEQWTTLFGVPDYSDNIQLDEITHHGFASAAFEFRQTIPGTFGPERTVTVANSQTVNFSNSHGPVMPVVQLNGPFTDPTITLGDTRIGLRGSALAGDYWIVDPIQRTIFDRWGINVPARADRQTMLSRISVAPESLPVRLESAPSADITWRPFSRSLWGNFEMDFVD